MSAPDPHPSDDSGDDAEFSQYAAISRLDREATLRSRATMLVVLLAVLLPFAGCGFLFAVCTVFGR